MTGVDVEVKPSGSGCAECSKGHGWWFHLRRCALCGHVGCCDSSPGQHATQHFRQTGHPIIQSFEPGEDWFWDFKIQDIVSAPTLAAPHSHPAAQPTPGPKGRVPANWQELLRG